MKKTLFIIAVLGIFGNSFAQETVTNKNGKEISVNDDASNTTKGIIKLAGDLGGTADTPTIPSLTNKLEGSGTINYISKFSAAKTLGNSQLFDDGTNLGIGTIVPLSRFSNAANTSNFVSSNNSIQSAGGITWLTNTTGFNTSLYNSNNAVGSNGLQIKVANTSPQTIAFEVGQNTSLSNASTPLFNVLGNGFVGIGTSVPTSRFSNTPTQIIGSNVQSSSSVTGFAWANNASGWGASFWSDYEGLNVKVKNTSTIAFEVGSGIASQNNNVGAGGSTPLLKVLTNGNVGIGTTAPTAQLEVATTNGFSAIIRRASNALYTSSNLILQKTFSTDPAISTAVPSGQQIGRILFSASNGTSTYPSVGPDIVGYTSGTQTTSTNGGGIVFRTVKEATNTVVERLKIDHNGNIGIGVIPPSSEGTLVGTPAAILDIKSDDSGVLVPRMTSAQRTAISLNTALKGMLVFDTDVNMFYYNVGTSWSPINLGTIKTITSAYTLLPEDNGRTLDVTSATALTITVPNTLPVGFQVSVTQAGAGQVTITGGAGMTVRNRYAATRTSGQWAKVGLEVRAAGSSVLSGDLQ